MQKSRIFIQLILDLFNETFYFIRERYCLRAHIFITMGAYFIRLIQSICHHETLDFKGMEKTIHYTQNSSENLVK